MSEFFPLIKKQWLALQARERLVLGVGAILVGAIIFYALILGPWHLALNNMTTALPKMRENLVWMRTQAEALENGDINRDASQFNGGDQSLLSIVEQTAKRAGIQGAIQQLVPGKKGSEVRVVMGDAEFNKWLAWIDVLYKQYGVDIEQVVTEREDERPNIVEIRATFIR